MGPAWIWGIRVPWFYQMVLRTNRHSPLFWEAFGERRSLQEMEGGKEESEISGFPWPLSQP